jgi:hypothetical protein
VGRYCAWKEVPFNEARACVAAAMLHDIGHGPFSHTLEPLFKERFGIDHHTSSERIIFGRTGDAGGILNVLREHDIEPERVAQIISGDDELYDNLFSSPINPDTIEGILRSREYISLPATHLDPVRVLHAATFRATHLQEGVVDDFWKIKDEMYHLFIRSPAGVLCDFIFADIIGKIQDLSPSDFYAAESDLFKRAPLLTQILDSGFDVHKLREHLPASIEYVERRFFVDGAGDFFKREDQVRYRQVKKAGNLNCNEVQGEPPRKKIGTY